MMQLTTIAMDATVFKCRPCLSYSQYQKTFSSLPILQCFLN